jgi:hypothetical protein
MHSDIDSSLLSHLSFHSVLFLSAGACMFYRTVSLFLSTSHKSRSMHEFTLAAFNISLALFRHRDQSLEPRAADSPCAFELCADRSVPLSRSLDLVSIMLMTHDACSDLDLSYAKSHLISSHCLRPHLIGALTVAAALFTPANLK